MKKDQWRWRSLLACCVAGVLAVGVSACGDDDDEDSGGSAATPAQTTGGTETGGGAASSVIAEATKFPEAPGPTKPVGKAIPKGKTIDYIFCGQVACKNYEEGLREAAAAIGWKVKTINVEPTPQSIQAGFQQAVRDKPDAVASAGFDVALYQKQAQALQKAGTMVTSVTGRDLTGEGVDLQVLGNQDSIDAMAILGKVAAEQQKEGTIGTVTLSGYPIVKDYTGGFADAVTAGCPGCSVKNLDIAPTSIGKDASAKIANFIRSNRGMKAIYISYDDLNQGLPAAIKGAGVTDAPKVYSWAPTTLGYKAVQDGTTPIALVDPFKEMGWQLVYGMALWETDQKERIKEAEKLQSFPVIGKEFDNVPTDANNPAYVPDYQTKWKALLK